MATRQGTITLIQGCMFSGKTSEVLRHIARAGEEAIAFKHVIDRRYAPDAIVTHDRRSHPAIAIQQASDLLGLIRPSVPVVAIDEAHFFGDDLPAALSHIGKSGSDVVAAGLDRDSWGNPFPRMVRMAELADCVVNRTAVCGRCGGHATRTQRLVPVIDRNMVGGPESYEPRCAACWTPPPQPLPAAAMRQPLPRQSVTAPQ